MNAKKIKLTCAIRGRPKKTSAVMEGFPVRTFCGQGVGQEVGGQVFTILCGRLLWMGPY